MPTEPWHFHLLLFPLLSQTWSLFSLRPPGAVPGPDSLLCQVLLWQGGLKTQQGMWRALNPPSVLTCSSSGYDQMMLGITLRSLYWCQYFTMLSKALYCNCDHNLSVPEHGPPDTFRDCSLYVSMVFYLTKLRKQTSQWGNMSKDEGIGRNPVFTVLGFPLLR